MPSYTRSSLVRWIWLPLVLLIAASLACTRSSQPGDAPWQAPSVDLPKTALARITASPEDARAIPQVTLTPRPILTPTPDAPRLLPTMRAEQEQYVVQPNDTLSMIAQRFQVSLEALLEVNDIPNPNYLEVGQVLSIPAPEPGKAEPYFKIIPDSELVYSPSSLDFDIAGFILEQRGYLARYEEDVDGKTLTGVEVVTRIAQEYSVNPRLLLAVLEYRSGWVTQANPKAETRDYPILRAEAWRKGLYRQLAWAANTLNRGYYLWKVNAIGYWILADGEIVMMDAAINAGTAAVQHLFANLYSRQEWETAVSRQGLYSVYDTFFGYPFHRAVEPLLPPGLQQPKMQLPFEEGLVWYFTGGPHGGWGDGSAWAALDFAPPSEALGCVTSDAWVVAVADGTIIRSGDGEVVQDLDVAGFQTSDGLEQTGWTVLYMHIESRDRVQAGAYVRAGERIGHPSCEGGFSTGTHLHLARRYNGEWISADQDIPFVLDGWISSGSGVEYDGFLKRKAQSVEAWEGHLEENSIQR